MSTSESPIEVLTAEAQRIARHLKDMTRPGGTGVFKFGIAQDDKTVTIEITAGKITETSEEALTQWLLSILRGETPQ